MTTTLDDISQLTESIDIECKLAQGSDGKGELPKDFWRTYSAMANAYGGYILLGVSEKNGTFKVIGIRNIHKVRTDLFNTANNSNKVSRNLLTDENVIEIEEQSILIVKVPAATRKQKPVFLNGNPLGNTYKRLHDGDRLCDDETVKRMLAEQIEDIRDERILEYYGLNDLNIDSLRAYRQMLRDEKPEHPYLDLDDLEFLKRMGGWRCDRATGKEGLTLAGLLMFGSWSSIQEAVVHYFVDYQEQITNHDYMERRWIDRLVPDGTWSGNLFDFYHRVYRKLIVDLKIPFSLRDGRRQEDTPVHQALREALVNTLVHADYTGRISILVIKKPDRFIFRNPGNSRLPLEQIKRGGESDCRNRILHQMFLMVGLGERAGSGIPKIMSGWKSQHWRQPHLYEKDDPEQMLLELHMLDLLPEVVVTDLRNRFGSKFDELSKNERLILATAAIEKVVNHNRLLEICDEHRRDLSCQLSRLVKEGFLLSEGRTKGMTYHLSGDSLPDLEQILDGTNQNQNSTHLSASSTHLPLELDNQSSSRNAKGCLINQQLDAPLIDSLTMLEADLRQELEQLASQPKIIKKLLQQQMEQVILNLCQEHFLTLNVLAELVNRSSNALRQQYLNKMVKAGKLRLAFPTKPTHVRQAYRVT